MRSLLDKDGMTIFCLRAKEAGWTRLDHAQRVLPDIGHSLAAVASVGVQGF
jgi:hypothetical protein